MLKHIGTRVNIMCTYKDDIRNTFYPRRKCRATIYALRSKNIFDKQDVVVVNCVSEEECKDGYMFGIMVKYGNNVYWVNPDDCEIC